MNRKEVAKIFAILKSNYNNFFKKLTIEEANGMVNLWALMFQEEPYEIVSAAVLSYIATKEDGFPPNVGEIKAHIRKLTEPQEMSEIEAANLIMKATANGYYNSKKEFEKLPHILQKLVGSSSKLKEWALMDSETLNSVVSSNIMRSYRVIQKQENEAKSLPPTVKKALSDFTEKLNIERIEKANEDS